MRAARAEKEWGGPGRAGGARGGGIVTERGTRRKARADGRLAGGCEGARREAAEQVLVPVEDERREGGGTERGAVRRWEVEAAVRAGRASVQIGVEVLNPSQHTTLR